MNESIYDTMKTVLEGNLLLSDDTRISQIKVKIIEDRNYQIPKWFYEYITDDDINTILMNQCMIKKELSSEFIEFMKYLDKNGIIHNYKYLASTIIQFEQSGGLFDTVYLFNSDKLYKYFKVLDDELTPLNTIQMIRSYTSRQLMVPYCYIKLYLRTVISKIWYSKPNKINEALGDLLDWMSPDELDYIYPVIYQYQIGNDLVILRNTYNYEHYMKLGGTWFNGDIYDPEDVYQYLYLYGMHQNKLSKKMDNRIKKVLFDTRRRSELMGYIPEDELKEMLTLFSSECIDNIEFIYWDIDERQLERLKLFFIINDNIMPKNLDKLIYLLFEGNSNNYTGIEDYLFNFIKYGNDIRKIVPYIKYIMTPEYFGKTISYMSAEDIDILGEINPIVNDKSGMTFIDMICNNLQLLNNATINKIRKVFSSNQEIYKLLYPEERHILFMKNRDIYEIASKFPGILLSDEYTNLDFIELYKKNTEVISYFNPIYIKDVILYNHIKTYGYTPVRDIEYFGIELLLNLAQLFELFDKDVGYGYILDFSNIGFVNICILYLLQK